MTRSPIPARLRRRAAVLAGVVALATAGASGASGGGAGDSSSLRAGAPDHPALSSSARGDSRLGRPPEARRTSGTLPAALVAALPAVTPPRARPVARVALRPSKPRPCAIAARSSRGPPEAR
jgi:hypothetical protein